MRKNIDICKQKYTEQKILRSAIQKVLSIKNRNDLRSIINDILSEDTLEVYKQSFDFASGSPVSWSEDLVGLYDGFSGKAWYLMSTITSDYSELALDIHEKYCELLKQTKNIVFLEDAKNSPISSESDEFKKTWKDPKPVKVGTLLDNHVEALKDKIDVLIITASQTERDYVLELLKPCFDWEEVLMRKSKIKGIPTCYFGKFGSHIAIVIMCDDRNIIDTYIQIDAVEKKYKPCVAIMVGIACGKSSREQKIGDVLISSVLIPYDDKRNEPDGQINTSVPVRCDKSLERLFTDYMEKWPFPHHDRYECEVRKGPILTGSILHNDLTEKDTLFERFKSTNPIGLEMEGYALHKASHGNDVPWILVKAISDWGDGEKDKIEGRPYRKFAAAAAASLVNHILQNNDALTAFERKP